MTDFTLGTLMDAVNLAEFDGRNDAAVIDELARTQGTFGAGKPPAHSGLVAWSIEAFRNYRAAWRAHQEAMPTPCSVPVRSRWKISHRRDAADHRGVRQYEQTCWGRRYRSEDDHIREMWLLGLTTPSGRPEEVTTAAANVAAFGGNGPPDQVRVVLFGATSSVAVPVLDRTTEQIRARAREKVAPRLLEIVDGTTRQAGRDCAVCPDTPGCAALPAADLLPEVTTVPGPRRTLSVTDLRYHQGCPARYHLRRQLHLRDTGLIESRPILIGRAVDATLRDRHTGRPRRCRPDDPAGEDVAALLKEDQRSAREILARHATLCPFPDVEEVRDDQHQFIVAHHTRLDVVFGGTPDLLYRRADTWVWRETKTSRRRLRRDRPLLRQVPQLALAVLILSAGAPGRSPGRSRVELEHLRPDGCALEELDPVNPAVVAEARKVIGELAGPLLGDTACAPGVAHLTASGRSAP
ncbi:PD-(D/E)XK nuclease family protein [Amycolatopsis sp. H20-H5]|uniref:PD-(D/E)XK nuclease family protein n=1 Tax=Amycolatopsis sp. H20-H5 TaxID=3046309 RepID=UPI002DB76CF0|nr:PD-(D/E)XK nuclease family protein [Amycolatopsis sp. H20-H5]MEC3980450.1 PD-(D/E)XK nuclease family protein [Amycolatopsis sp. H20-H5]